MLGLTFVAGEPIPHLFFVISKASPEGRVLVVNITDIKNRIGCESCILKKGDHPFIIKPSKALYSHAIAPFLSDVKAKIEEGIFDKRQNANYDIILSLQAGAKISPELDEKFQYYFNYF
ncbi:hypothetical protein EHQ53_08505 [Leptospira langatensis]|uniref:Uncharacterized protein n=1 Tax=Leptospira langatensis TaxID=2484983 RepID=A0A5F1ZWJ4_9LEPT|nr:hypothetical protein [Leptospira langatensis]TGK01330.1 hypothetical protein EHO57_10365 [Leptospira langatensis]TGL42218.1 hypothetical protein EHQ53_08505 [Leptospira langatensis]